MSEKHDPLTCGLCHADGTGAEISDLKAKVDRLRKAIRVALERDHDAMDSWCRELLAAALGREDGC